jgi:hypothetical protein
LDKSLKYLPEPTTLRRSKAIPIGVGELADQSESAACHVSTLPIHSHMPLTWHSWTKGVTSAGGATAQQISQLQVEIELTVL